MESTQPVESSQQTPHRLNRALALLVAGTFFMENLDGTIIATAAPAIAADLGVQPVDINLTMTAYLVTVAVGIPVSGWLADRFGGKRIFMIAIAIFTLASALCAVSTSLTELSVFRVLQGLGGAMMVPVGRLVVLRTTEKRDLLDAIAYLTWPALVAPVIAPFLGGWLSTYAGWEWIFLVNIPLGVLAFVVAIRVVPSMAAGEVPALDWIGFLLTGLTLAALLLGMEQVGASGRSGWLVVTLLVTAGVAGVLTVWRMLSARHPLLDLRALHVQTFRVGNASGMVYRMAISAAPFLLPLMFQLAFGWTAVHAGLMVMAVFAGNVLIKPATSPLIRRFGFRTVIIGAASGGVLMFAACAFLTPQTPVPVIAAVLFLSGVFRSIGFSGYNSLQFADIPAEEMSGANTLSSTIGQLAAGLGVAVGALALRLSDAALDEWAPELGVLADYQFAFVVIAVLMLYPVIEAVFGLHRAAGGEVAGIAVEEDS
ncbi:MAG: DHA2 family efflux MFS transporter permease subunit [Propionibacteriaceae bacterium]